MKLVVIGGTGLVGSKVVAILRDRGHEAVAVSPNSGVNTITGEGLADALAGASAVVDVSNSPSFEDAAVLEFFETSTRNLLDAEAAAGVGHHVAVSIVGADRLPESGYLRAKVAQEKLIERLLDPVLDRPLDPVLRVRPADRGLRHRRRRGAPAVGGLPAGGVRRPRRRGRRGRPGRAAERRGRGGRAGAVPLRRAGPPRPRRPPRSRRVVADPDARYFGARLDDGSIVPEGEAVLGEARIDDWLGEAEAEAGR